MISEWSGTKVSSSDEMNGIYLHSMNPKQVNILDTK